MGQMEGEGKNGTDRGKGEEWDRWRERGRMGQIEGEGKNRTDGGRKEEQDRGRIGQMEGEGKNRTDRGRGEEWDRWMQRGRMGQMGRERGSGEKDR